MTLEDTGIRRRTPSAEIIDGKLVRSAVAPIVRRMTSLQRECAFINAQVGRLGVDQLERRMTDLRGEAISVRRSLEALVERLSPSQQSHSRVVDIRRALDHLIESLPSTPSDPHT